MRYVLSITLATLITLSISLTLEAAEITPENSVTIHSYEEDITGDGSKETIELKGELLSKGSKFYRDIWVDIANRQSNKKWMISYGGGYDPSLQFIDLNQDNITDLFVQIQKENKGDYYTYHIHTMDKGDINRLVMPEQSHINGYFKDNFTIDLIITHNETPISLNVKQRYTEYIQLGIYNQEGKLKKPTSIITDPISRADPLLISKSKGYGIRTTQHIYGSTNHLLGAIKTIWYFEMDNWIILRTKWVPL